MTPEGALFNNRYELVALIGAGGMGEVWIAEDHVLQRRVAVKLLALNMATDPQFRARFQQEITAAASVEHPNVVPVYDGGFDERFFIVMRVIDGPDLRHLISDGGLEPERAMRLFSDTARGLQAVHDQGYVHRDVKPANVLVGSVGRADEYAALVDFGIARALERPLGVTQGRPPGTPVYMAPETWEHWVAAEAADQYALGCVLFEMLTGRPPFEGDSALELEQSHCHAKPPELGMLLPEASAGLAEALERALSKDPTHRHPSVADFAVAAMAEPFEQTATELEPTKLQLSPNGVATALFGVAPDRDEKSPQLAMETYLTLWANDYARPSDGVPRTPKRRNTALRSLALGTNFAEGMEEPAPNGQTYASLGDALSRGRDFANSANLALAQQALRALVDPQTEQGSAGASLMLPFHESLLWFDARRSGTKGARWSVRKVNMRGTGITLARMLLDPPPALGDEVRADADVAVAAIREALQAGSPFAALAGRLVLAMPEAEPASPEPAEADAWSAGTRPELAELTRRIVRHARNVASDTDASSSTRLLHLRAILALDVAHHILSRSWEAIAAPTDHRFMLLTYAPEARRENRVRIASEGSFQAGRQSIIQALIATLARRSAEIAGDAQQTFEEQFEPRSKLDEIAAQMAMTPSADQATFAALAGRVYEDARGGGYARAVDAFRVLLGSVELVRGTGSYRWLQAGPDLLAAMIAAVGRTPMEAPQFLERVRDEWDIVIGEAEAVGTALESTLDGGLLNRNARHLERTLVASGLAQSLSDQTCMVGQRMRDAT